MVNDGFPKAPPYGFEMVHVTIARRGSESIENLRGSTKSDYFFANLRRIKVAASTSDLFKAASQLKNEIKRLLGLLGVAWMFFLLRLTFWLGLVLVLLPREKTPESEKLPQIGASEAVQAATAAVSDMGQFCKRQPAACEVGGQAATMIGARAQEGAKKLYQIITDKKSGDHTGSIGGDTEELEAELAGMAPRDTLTSDDLAVEWRGVP
jgi:hypothetical protein